jgi:glutamine synthetase
VGPDNREAAVRVPSTFLRPAGSTNAELKASDSSSNPYLALGGLLAARARRRHAPARAGEPVLVDRRLSEGERRERGSSGTRPLREALDQLEADAVLMSALGPTLARAYLAVKRSEAEAFGREDAAFETKHHFWKF